MEISLNTMLHRHFILETYFGNYPLYPSDGSNHYCLRYAVSAPQPGTSSSSISSRSSTPNEILVMVNHRYEH